MLVEGLENRQLVLLRAVLAEERHRLDAVLRAHPSNLVAQREAVRAMERTMYVGLVLNQRAEASNFARARVEDE